MLGQKPSFSAQLMVLFLAIFYWDLGSDYVLSSLAHLSYLRLLAFSPIVGLALNSHLFLAFFYRFTCIDLHVESWKS